MAGFYITVAASVLVYAGLAVLAWAGFRNGDFTGEALARALRKDLEESAAGPDRLAPPP